MITSPKHYNQLSASEEQRAIELHQQAIVIDALQVPILDQLFFEELEAGGVTAINATTHLSTRDHSARDGVLALQAYRDWVDANPDHGIIATRAQDIEAAKAANRSAIILGFQYDTVVEDNISMLRVFHTMGLRIFQLTYNLRGPLADGCLEAANGGLSNFGRRAIKSMNQMGMLIDLSHTGDRATIEAIEMSEAPVAFTHANPRALSPTRRGKTDEAIMALAARGGVIGATFWANITATEKGVRPGVEDVIQHIDYLVNLVGVDHVGFGSDFGDGVRDAAERVKHQNEFVTKYPEMREMYHGVRDPVDLEDSTKIPNITRGLVARGYSDEAILKILGGNWLRLFRTVWGS